MAMELVRVDRAAREWNCGSGPPAGSRNSCAGVLWIWARSCRKPPEAIIIIIRAPLVPIRRGSRVE